jgi:hypothetical protein
MAQVVEHLPIMCEALSSVPVCVCVCVCVIYIYIYIYISSEAQNSFFFLRMHAFEMRKPRENHVISAC